VQLCVATQLAHAAGACLMHRAVLCCASLYPIGTCVSPAHWLSFARPGWQCICVLLLLCPCLVHALLPCCRPLLSHPKALSCVWRRRVLEIPQQEQSRGALKQSHPIRQTTVRPSSTPLTLFQRYSSLIQKILPTHEL